MVGGGGWLYEPTGGRWQKLAIPLLSLSYPSSVRLPDNRVLIINNDNSYISGNAVIYDAIKREASEAGSLALPRRKFATAVLGDGSVLVTGGVWFQRSPPRRLTTPSAELWSAAAGRWVSPAALMVSRAMHTATLLQNGKVLVANGATNRPGSTSDPSFDLASAELFDPSTGSWSMASPTKQARAHHTATLLHDGRVLVVGGKAPTTTEIYDPRSNTWLTPGQLIVPRTSHSAALLKDGSVLVCGGIRTFPTMGPSLSSCEIFDPKVGAWTSVAGLSEAVVGHTLTTLQDGRVLRVGGDVEGQHLSQEAEIFDSKTKSWIKTSPLPT